MVGFLNLKGGEAAVEKHSRRYLLMVLDDTAGAGNEVSKLLRSNAAGDLKVTLDGEEVAITVAALPLPSGAATAAKQLPDGHKVEITDGADDLGVFKEGDALGATPAGLVLMAESATGNAKPLVLGATGALSTYLITSLPSGTNRIGAAIVRGSSDTAIDDRTKAGELGLVVAPVTQPADNLVVDDCTSTTSTAIIASPGAGKHLEIHYLKVLNRAATENMITFQWSGATGTDIWGGVAATGNSDADGFGNNPLAGPTNQGLNFKAIGSAPGANEFFAVVAYNEVDD